MSVCCPSSAGYQSGLHKSRDVRECQPGVTTGESRMFQALVVPDRYPAGHSASLHRLGFMQWLRWLGSQAKRPLIVHIHIREPPFRWLPVRLT